MNSYSAFKFVNAKGMLFLFQVLAETVLIPQIFDDLLIQKGILNITLLIDLIKIF